MASLNNELTRSERRAISHLKVLEREWPKTLWIFCADSHLHVMRKDIEGRLSTNKSGGFNQDFIVETIHIESDGGDW